MRAKITPFLPIFTALLTSKPLHVNLTEISIRRPSLIIVMFAVLSFMGVSSYFNLPIELVPKFSPSIITIVTIYPGASPSEVENAVSKPIEDALSSLEGIEQLQVASQENSSFIIIELDQKADIDKAVQEMQRKVNQLLANLPKEVRPRIGRHDGYQIYRPGQITRFAVHFAGQRGGAGERVGR